MIEVIALFLFLFACIVLGILKIISRDSWFFGTDEYGHENNLVNPVFFVVMFMTAIMVIIWTVK